VGTKKERSGNTEAMLGNASKVMQTFGNVV
jgi:hypothetical protein